MKKEKSQAELYIDAMQDVFGIATTGFEDFYKNAKNAKIGDYSQSAANGYSSKSAANGYSSKSAANGYSSQSAANGNYSQSAANGDSSKSAANGNYSQSAANGDSSKSAANGDSSKSAANGDSSKSAANGNYSQSACSGENSACSALGYRAAVKGGSGNLIMASEYIKKNGKLIPIGGKADIVDGKKLKANQWYIVEGGEWIAVDFTDGIFSYVISNKSRIKKIRTESGEILFVVSDNNGNSAHGKTIKKAREDLVYKAVVKFDGKIPKSATGKEWIGIYRSVTGACSDGIKHFVEQTGKSLDKTYTAKEIAKLAKGKYGAEKFAEKAKEVI